MLKDERTPWNRGWLTLNAFFFEPTAKQVQARKNEVIKTVDDAIDRMIQDKEKTSRN